MKRKDKFYYKAKRENIRARSYYKLKELDEKFNLFNFNYKNNFINFYKKKQEIEEEKKELKKTKKTTTNKENNIYIIDLGCAPGAWLQYINSKTKLSKTNSRIIKVIGIDILEIKNKEEFSENIKIYQTNFLDDDFTKIIEKEKIKSFDIILSDMAPEFTGQRERDFYNTFLLNREVIKFASNYLKKNGKLIFKTFQNKYINELIEIIKEELSLTKKDIKFYKPKSSKKESPETYVFIKRK